MCFGSQNRIITVIVSCFSYALVFFHRYSTSVLAKQLATSMNVPVDDINLFGSMYFWTYAIMQPIGGMLADIIEPGLLICISTMVSSIGSLGIGFSRNYVLSCVLRCLVGLGCGPIYVPLNRVLASHFSPERFGIVNGILISSGSIGGLLAQGPLASMIEVTNWSWAFIGPALLGSVIAVIAPIMLKENVPNKKASGSVTNHIQKLKSNLKEVVSNSNFWKLVSWGFFGPPTFFSLAGFWGVPYIVSVFDTTNEKAGYIMLMLTFSSIIGAPVFALISEYFRTRKYLIFVGSIVSAISSLGFFFFNISTRKFLLWANLFIFGLSTNALIGIATTMYKEMSTPDIAATTMGCANFFPFISSTIIQNLIGFLLKMIDGAKSNHHTPKSYRYGLWITNAISCAISIIGIFLAKETYITPEKPSDIENYQNID